MLKENISKYISIKDVLKWFGCILCFVVMEIALRCKPEMRVPYVSLTDEVPLLFDILYGLAFTTFIMFIPPKMKRMKKWLYFVLWFFWSFFMFSQYIYCRIFDRVYGLKTLKYAGEGGEFAALVVPYLDSSAFSLLLVFIVCGIVGFFLLPEFPVKKGSSGILRAEKSVIFALSVAGILLVPFMFKTPPENGGGGSYQYKKNIYSEWIDNKRSVSMFGAYEFLTRDFCLLFKQEEVSEEDVARVSDYYSRHSINENEMTGILKGKNLVLVLMESMDDWLINEETTPTICKMMNEGINFTNMYTPIFGSASTLNSEFCSYTGLVAPADGTPLVNYTNNKYPYSLPYLFTEEGYVSKSFHYNTADFYNRSNIHNAVGFEEYVSFLDYEEAEIAEQDAVLMKNSSIYEKFIEKVPFFNYVITYSAHANPGAAAYTHEDEALKIYPEYIGKYKSEEMDSISAKARLTDDMFAAIIENLERDGLLEDTVIIGFADHYDYTIFDQQYLMELSNSENTYELSKTPFFIWSKGMSPQSIAKVVNTTDIYPTICNLFDLKNQKYFLGNDAFDDLYEGYAYWQDGSWISDEGAFYNSEGIYKGDISAKKRQEMGRIVDEKLKINQLIFDTDYFKQIENK